MKFADRVNLALSIQKTHPDIVDIRMYDVGAYYENPLWHIEAEYLRKNYARDAFEGVNVVDAFVCRNLPLRNCRALRQISILARYDYMSDHSKGIADPTTGRLVAGRPGAPPRDGRCDAEPGSSLPGGHPATRPISTAGRLHRPSPNRDKVVTEFMVASRDPAES